MKIQKLINFVDKTRSGFWTNVLCIPILIAEYILYRKLWKKIFLPEIIENDTIFQFFDENQFQLKFGKLQKKDLLDISIFDEDDLPYARQEITSVYITQIYNVLKPANYNLADEIVVLNVDVYQKLLRDVTGKLMSAPIFEINLEYQRLTILIGCVKRAIKQITTLFAIILFLVLLYFGFNLLY